MNLVEQKPGVTEIARFGNGAKRDQLSKRKDFVGEGVDEDLGMDLLELSHGRAFF